MCGIAGLISFEPREDGEDLLEHAEGMADLLTHRGPDDSGAYLSSGGQAALAHRRLSIIDLSPAASQPMQSPDGRRRIVYNGEIYNFREIRGDLERRGESFTTQSDTEAILRLLILDGPDALSRLRGMFALALLDEEEGSILLARDRFGIKPLYIHATQDRVAFASEIRALRRCPGVGNQVSAAGVLAFLRWGSIPGPLTWIEGISALPPGSWRKWDREGKERGGVFADVRRDFVRNGIGEPIAEEDLRERTRLAFEESVRAHLVADVPVGIFLSGGIDSSAVVSTARAVSTGKIRTYTVAFDDPGLSEERYAREVADRYETEHHVIRVTLDSIRDDLPKILRHMDQPTVDGVNSYYVSSAVAATGLKAVLSGAGGDELFGGYSSFRRVPAAGRIRKVLRPLLRAIGPGLASRRSPARRAKWEHYCRGPEGIHEVWRAKRGLYMPHELDALAGPALLEPDVLAEAQAAVDDCERRLLSPVGRESPRAAVSRLETRLYLGSQLLRDVDVMSMAHSLETRVPFVDHELHRAVWPALSSHPRLMRNKRLLYETLSKPLPEAVYDRPKQGFLLPFESWLRGHLQGEVREGMQEAARRGWVAEEVPDATWTAWTEGRIHWSRPWALSILGHLVGDGH